MAPVTKQFWKYDEAQLKEAGADVSRGMALSSAATKYKVPRTSLRRYVEGKTREFKKMGPSAILSREEERILVRWIASAREAGFPVDKDELFYSVQRLLKDIKRKNNFTDDRPGRTWYQCFIKRNPTVTIRVAQNLTASRALVTELSLSKWFSEVYSYLKNNTMDHILKEPNRVYNADESAFFLSPKGSRVLAMKGDKNVYQHINNNEKECVTVLINANAAGQLGPSLVVFKYERIPQDIITSVPTEWGLGKSDSGWMTGDLFYQYITNVFHPWLVINNIPLPIILFVDGHTSHLTLQTSTFCNDNGIVLVALYPNATHLIQPLDVAVFRPVKLHWKNKVHAWRRAHVENPTVKKKDFCPLLKEVLAENIEPLIIQNGFQKCGLVPWCPEAPIRTFQETSSQSPDAEVDKTELNLTLRVLERYIGQEKVNAFKHALVWSGAEEDKSPFHVWAQIKSDITKVDNMVPQINDSEEGINTRSLIESTHETTLPSDPVGTMVEDSVQFSLAQGTNVLSQLESDNSVNVNNDGPCCSKTLLIPSPFKRSFNWHEKAKKIVSEKKSGAPTRTSVLTSDEWRKNEEDKRNKKLEVQKQKEERKLARQKKKEEREKLKRMQAEEKMLKKNILKHPKKNKRQKKNLPDSSSEDDASWVPSGRSSDDLSIGLNEDEEYHIGTRAMNAVELEEVGGIQEVSEVYNELNEFEIDSRSTEGQCSAAKREENEPTDSTMKKMPGNKIFMGTSEDEAGDGSSNENMYATMWEENITSTPTNNNTEMIPEDENLQENILVGDFVLGSFPSKNKNDQTVCLITNVVSGEIRATILKLCKRMRNVFLINSKDSRILSANQIQTKLPQPLVFGTIDNKRYQFPYSIDVAW